jgi:hypothetical protein
MTPTPPPPAFLSWWDARPHAYAVTASEAWLCKRYQEEWKESGEVIGESDPRVTPSSEQWWQR